MLEYRIIGVTGRLIVQLFAEMENRVMEASAEGWSLLGGVSSIIDMSGEESLRQAMTRPKPEECYGNLEDAVAAGTPNERPEMKVMREMVERDDKPNMFASAAVVKKLRDAKSRGTIAVSRHISCRRDGDVSMLSFRPTGSYSELPYEIRTHDPEELKRQYEVLTKIMAEIIDNEIKSAELRWELQIK